MLTYISICDIINEIISKRRKMNYSFITILSSDAYLPGVLALAHSLKQVKTKYPFNVLIPSDVEITLKKKLTQAGLSVITAQNLVLDADLADKNKRPYWNKTFFKLRLFELTSFDKIVYLDSDMIVLQNIDDLFEKAHMSATVAGKCERSEWTKLNSGLMVIEPNLQEAERIRKNIRPTCESLLETIGAYGDQDVIQFSYPNWQDDKNLLLDECYNVMSCVINSYCNRYGLDSIKVFHYAGGIKPWQYDKFQLLKSKLKRMWKKCNKPFFVYLKYLKAVAYKP